MNMEKFEVKRPINHEGRVHQPGKVLLFDTEQIVNVATGETLVASLISRDLLWDEAVLPEDRTPVENAGAAEPVRQTLSVSSITVDDGPSEDSTEEVGGDASDHEEAGSADHAVESTSLREMAGSDSGSKTSTKTKTATKRAGRTKAK